MHQLDPPDDDGLYIPSVKEHSKAKHWFLSRYIDAFTTSMKGKWSSLHYIDLFAGAGIERLSETGALDWGSPLIAAQARYPFAGLHLCEKNRRKYEALIQRFHRLDSDAQVLRGDANKRIDEIVRTIPARTLSLAFLDPYGLHLEFEKITKLSSVRADLIIFFPDRLDALRNWERHYLPNPDSNLDRCLGSGADWRQILDSTPQDHLAEALRKLYIQQIRSLGYTEFRFQRISSKGHPLYVLLLCSRSEIAAKLWSGISAKDRNGQRILPFGE
jgi:three-Cys-motif partner protein